MNLRKLFEEFDTFVGGVSIYKNPTFSELQTIIKEKNYESIEKDYEIRFMAYYQNKTSYFFDANILHMHVCLGLKLPYSRDDAFLGVGEFNPKTNKLRYVSSNFVLKQKEVDFLLKKDWSFVSKYFEVPIEEIIKGSVGKN